MAAHSAITWTDATWNLVTGCSKVSPGCQHCYAERLSYRYGWPRACRDRYRGITGQKRGKWGYAKVRRGKRKTPQALRGFNVFWCARQESNLRHEV